MKKTILTLLVVISFFNLTSCSSDDNKPDPKKNEIETNEKNIPITNIRIFNEGSFNTIDVNGTPTEVVEYVLYIMNGLDISNDQEFSNKGDYLILVLTSPSENKLTSGTYNYNQNSDGFLLDEGAYLLNYDATQGDDRPDRDVEIASGSITVDRDEDNYTIQINLKDSNNNNVTGFYKGNITTSITAI